MGTNERTASDASHQKQPKEKLRGITIHLSDSESTHDTQTEAEAKK